MKTKEIYLNFNSLAGDFVKSYEYPYMALADIKSFILELGSNLGEDFLKIADDVWIHQSVTIPITATIIGPCIIDENTEVRPGAYIRGAVLVGKGCVVGNSCELKNSILFDGAKTPHYNYIGDSILGNGAHFGAGSLTSNVKSDNSNVVIKGKDYQIETGRRKVGAFVGDNVEIGCNCVLNPGTVIGPNSRVYPLTSVRGVIPANSIVKNMDNIVIKN